MKVLVIGGGGREHALVWGLRRSLSVSKIWCAPGNGGISDDASCLPIDLNGVSGIADLAENLAADLTVVGPEQPLVLGVADEFARRGLCLLGPSAECAQLEGSKLFTKRFLDRHSIPTARLYGVFDQSKDALEALAHLKFPVVLKADGLCAGKGVLVAQNAEEAYDFVGRVLDWREFGAGGGNLLIEEALNGRELSFIILTDGDRFAPLPPCRDHKRVFDADRGPNTGGMGVYSSDDILPDTLRAEILQSIVLPTLGGLKADGLSYRGFLYFGLMLTAEGPSVLEFNCRLGDPETQAIIPRLKCDLGSLLKSAADCSLNPSDLEWRPGASVCVVMASGGYPGSFQTGLQIEGLEAAASTPEVAVFHAGTRKDDHYYTCSGRVLGVTAIGRSLPEARANAYAAVNKIHFAHAHYRTDIGSQAMPLSEAAGN